MDKIEHISFTAGGELNSDEFAASLLEFNKMLLRTYGCRTVFHTRQMLQKHNPERLRQFDSHKHNTHEHFLLDNDIIIPFYESEAREPSRSGTPLGYFAIPDGKSAKNPKRLVALVQSFGEELIHLTLRRELVELQEGRLCLQEKNIRSNIVPMKDHTDKDLKRNPSTQTASTSRRVPFIVLPWLTPILVMGSDSTQTHKAALLLHDLLDRSSFVTWGTIPTSECLHPDTWKKLTGHTFYCAHADRLPPGDMIKIKELTTLYNTQEHPLWIGGIDMSLTSSVALTEVKIHFRKVFFPSKPTLDTQELQQELEHFLLLHDQLS